MTAIAVGERSASTISRAVGTLPAAAAQIWNCWYKRMISREKASKVLHLAQLFR
jgi:hypothetical protein